MAKEVVGGWRCFADQFPLLSLFCASVSATFSILRISFRYFLLDSFLDFLQSNIKSSNFKFG